jgi:hypothetical protein
MKRLITLRCWDQDTEPHDIPIILDIRIGKEDAEVLGAIPVHCPLCDRPFTELERDGFLMEIGEHADAIISEQYPKMFIRVLPMEATG